MKIKINIFNQNTQKILLKKISLFFLETTDWLGFCPLQEINRKNFFQPQKQQSQRDCNDVIMK